MGLFYNAPEPIVYGGENGAAVNINSRTHTHTRARVAACSALLKLQQNCIKHVHSESIDYLHEKIRHCLKTSQARPGLTADSSYKFLLPLLLVPQNSRFPAGDPSPHLLRREDRVSRY